MGEATRSKAQADSEIARLEGLVAGLKGGLERQRRDIAALDRLKAWECEDEQEFTIGGVCGDAGWVVCLIGDEIRAQVDGMGVTLADATDNAFASLEAATPKVCECCGQAVKPEAAE